MKIFIYDITSYIGQALVELFSADEENRMVGTWVEGSPEPKNKKRIVDVYNNIFLIIFIL